MPASVYGDGLAAVCATVLQHEQDVDCEGIRGLGRLPGPPLECDLLHAGLPGEGVGAAVGLSHIPVGIVADLLDDFSQ